MTNLNNKLVLITGATGGFGRHFTEQMLAKGSKVILSDYNDDVLDDYAKSLNNANVLGIISSDLSTATGADQLFEQAQAIGPVDVLVNNAGLAMIGRHDEVPRDDWDRLMQVNLMAPMRLCALFSPKMMARGSGHFVNISSLAGWVGTKGLGAYVASKHGLRGFSTSLHDELKGSNVKVSAVYPYFSDTPILDSPQFGSYAAEQRQNRLKGVTKPENVVRRTIEGIEADRLHIFPDRTAKLIYRIQRFAPWLLPILDRAAA